jgi:hypothetical protein
MNLQDAAETAVAGFAGDAGSQACATPCDARPRQPRESTRRSNGFSWDIFRRRSFAARRLRGGPSSASK